MHTDTHRAITEFVCLFFQVNGEYDDDDLDEELQKVTEGIDEDDEDDEKDGSHNESSERYVNNSTASGILSFVVVCVARWVVGDACAVNLMHTPGIATTVLPAL